MRGRRMFVAGCVAALIGLAVVPLAAVGARTVTEDRITPTITRYTIAWTSSAGGAVSANPFSIGTGRRLLSVRFVPGSGGTQPSDQYDVTLVTNSVDVLAGGGANLSNSTPTIQQWDPPLFHDGASLDLVVANAGNAKTGTVVLYVESLR